MIELLAATIFAVAPLNQPNPKLDWWRDARFGMFIHWGLYAVPAGSWEDKGSVTQNGFVQQLRFHLKHMTDSSMNLIQ